MEKARQRSGSSRGEELFSEVYEELRRLAAAKMALESPGHTLQATALVHEAWLRLEPQNRDGWSRTDFFVAAASAMRRVLIDQIRRKKAVKRGGGAGHEELRESQIAITAPAEEIQTVDESLQRLEVEDSAAAQLVQLRYFAGFTMQEAADALEISLRSAHRLWSFAKAWLRRDVEKSS